MRHVSFLRSVLVLIICLSGNTYAIPTLSVVGDKLVGATDVDVGGTLYDVTFIDGSFETVFGNLSSLDATTLVQADDFSLAIVNQLLIGNFSNNPTGIFGCGDLRSCSIATPYAPSIAFRSAVSSSDFPDDLGHGFVGETTDLSGIAFDHLVWADWTVATDEPPLLLMIFSGFIILLSFRMRRSR